MLRHFLLAVCLVLSFSACQTVINNSDIAESSISDMEDIAISALSRDISAESEKSAMNKSDVEMLLPESYCKYKDYVPLYTPIKDAYISAIVSVLDDLNESLDEMFEAYSDVVKKGSDNLIDSDTALSDIIKSEYKSSFVSCLRNALNESVALNTAFIQSYNAFDSVRKAYGRLSEIGYAINLPEPDSIDAAVLAEKYIEAYFNRLAGFERLIKNQRFDSTNYSVYSVFWRRDV